MVSATSLAAVVRNKLFVHFKLLQLLQLYLVCHYFDFDASYSNIFDIFDGLEWIFCHMIVFILSLQLQSQVLMGCLS